MEYQTMNLVHEDGTVCKFSGYLLENDKHRISRFAYQLSQTTCVVIWYDSRKTHDYWECSCHGKSLPFQTCGHLKALELIQPCSVIILSQAYLDNPTCLKCNKKLKPNSGHCGCGVINGYYEGYLQRLGISTGLAGGGNIVDDPQFIANKPDMISGWSISDDGIGIGIDINPETPQPELFTYEPDDEPQLACEACGKLCSIDAIAVVAENNKVFRYCQSCRIQKAKSKYEKLGNVEMFDSQGNLIGTMKHSYSKIEFNDPGPNSQYAGIADWSTKPKENPAIPKMGKKRQFPTKDEEV